MARARRSPVPLASLVGSVVPRGAAQGDRVHEHVWARAVGLDVARRTRATTLENGVLTVVVSTSAWAQELGLLREVLVEKLRREGLRVSRVRYKVGKVEPLARAPERAVEIRPAPSRAPLPPEVARVVARVDDDELRTVIEGAARQNLAWQAETRATSRRPPSPALRSAGEGSARSDRTSPPPISGSRRRGGGA